MCYLVLGARRDWFLTPGSFHDRSNMVSSTKGKGREPLERELVGGL
jgi:hypothetical protein